jgi:hypothetical protein
MSDAAEPLSKADQQLLNTIVQRVTLITRSCWRLRKSLQSSNPEINGPAINVVSLPRAMRIYDWQPYAIAIVMGIVAAVSLVILAKWLAP